MPFKVCLQPGQAQAEFEIGKPPLEESGDRRQVLGQDGDAIRAVGNGPGYAHKHHNRHREQ